MESKEEQIIMESKEEQVTAVEQGVMQEVVLDKSRALELKAEGNTFYAESKFEEVR